MQVKKADENEILFHLFCVNSSVDDLKSESKDAIKHLRVILEYPDLDSSDAEVFRQAISKLEGVNDILDAVKEELGKTELSKIPMDGDADLPPGFSTPTPTPKRSLASLRGSGSLRRALTATTPPLRWSLPAAGRRAAASISTTGALPSRATTGGHWSPRRSLKCSAGRDCQSTSAAPLSSASIPASISKATTAPMTANSMRSPKKWATSLPSWGVPPRR